MIVYHGSYLPVIAPNISFSRHNLDFGKGFYTTPIYDQSAKWAKRFKGKKGNAIVSYYELDEKILWQNFSVKEFKEYSHEWLDYIISCRRGTSPSLYDIVIGGVANDKVFDTIELFFAGLIDKSIAIDRLRYEKPNLQICFCSQIAIDQCLFFQKSEVL